MDRRIRTLIIDDEPPARTILKKYLKDIDIVELIGECENGFDGLKAIQNLSPDLIMLDVQMPKLTGFELLELIDNPPRVIFVTAYDQYAIKAFEASAIDYLLKPYTFERLEQAVRKVTNTDVSNEQFQRMNDEIAKQHHNESLDRVLVRSGNKIHIINVKEIDYLKAQDDYVLICSSDEKYLKQQTMKYYEENLDEKSFFRAHRSFIVNISAIVSIDLFEKDSYILKMKNGDTIPVSKSGYAKLRSRF